MGYTLQSLTDIANRITYHRARAEAMGFKFTNIKVTEGPFTSLHDEKAFGDWQNDQVIIRCHFACVCGTPEEFRDVIPTSMFAGMPTYILEDRLDVAKQLTVIGFFLAKNIFAAMALATMQLKTS